MQTLINAEADKCRYLKLQMLLNTYPAKMRILLFLTKGCPSTGQPFIMPNL